MKIKLIYLAAGNSRRFNSQRMQNTEPPQSEAENKLLYLLDEKPMFRYLFDRLVKVCQRHPEWEMIVVTQYPEIEHQVKALQENEQQGERFPVKTVISKDSYKGAAYSVKAGIRAAGDADAYAFFVADQPYFTEESVVSGKVRERTSGTGRRCRRKKGVPQIPGKSSILRGEPGKRAGRY